MINFTNELEPMTIEEFLLEYSTCLKKYADKIALSGSYVPLNFFISNKDLSGVDFYGLNLSGVSFVNCNLTKASFSFCNLVDCLFSECLLYRAEFCQSDISKSEFGRSDLTETVFNGTISCKTIFYCSDLTNVTISKNSDGYFYNTVFKGAINPPNFSIACPEVGEFIGFKKCLSSMFGFAEAIVTLKIPKDARRSSATGRKCRCDKAEVIKIEKIDDLGNKVEDLEKAYSIFNNTFVYEVGKTVYPSYFCEKRYDECAGGIHFFTSREEALSYR